MNIIIEYPIVGFVAEKERLKLKGKRHQYVCVVSYLRHDI
jgi:hypothetical protein